MPRRKEPQFMAELVRWPDGQHSVRIRNTNNKQIIFWSEKYKKLDHAVDEVYGFVDCVRKNDLPMTRIVENVEITSITMHKISEDSDAKKDSTV